MKAPIIVGNASLAPNFAHGYLLKRQSTPAPQVSSPKEHDLLQGVWYAKGQYYLLQRMFEFAPMWLGIPYSSPAYHNTLLPNLR